MHQHQQCHRLWDNRKWIHLIWDGPWFKSWCNFMAAIQDGERDISHTMFITINWNDHDCNSCCRLFFSIKRKKEKKSQLYTSGSVEKLLSKPGSVENFFFLLVHRLPPGRLASNQGCHYPLWVLLMRDTRLCSWQGKKTHAQHFLKLLMFYPIIHRPGTWEYVFVGKPWLDMVEPASLVPVSPGGHVWKLLPQSISKVQVLKYLSRQSFILAVDCLSTLPAP